MGGCDSRLHQHWRKVYHIGISDRSIRLARRELQSSRAYTHDSYSTVSSQSRDSEKSKISLRHSDGLINWSPGWYQFLFIACRVLFRRSSYSSTSPHLRLSLVVFPPEIFPIHFLRLGVLFERISSSGDSFSLINLSFWWTFYQGCWSDPWFGL